MPRDFQRPFTLPEGATEVVLVRHGSSARNAPDEPVELIEGQSDPPLSEQGREQADAVASRLAQELIAGLFVTPLRRTGETAAPLADRLGHEPIVVADLREVHLGDWEGEHAENGSITRLMRVANGRWGLRSFNDTAHL